MIVQDFIILALCLMCAFLDIQLEKVKSKIKQLEKRIIAPQKQE
jgi:hypothetical protein